MGNNGKKRFVVNRKTFIIAIIAVCVVLAVAEGLLLSKVFSKKKDNDKKTKKQNEMQNETPTPTVPDVLNDVWKVSKVYVRHEDGEKALYLEYEYDESGRKQRIIKNIPGDLAIFYLVICYQNVTKWESKSETGYDILCGEDIYGNPVGMAGLKMDTYFSEAFDEQGNLIEISKRSVDSDEITEKWEYDFDDRNRTVLMKKYRREGGKLLLYRYFLYQYDSFDRVRGVEEYLVKDDGDYLIYKTEYDYAYNKTVRSAFIESIYYGSDEYSVYVYAGKQRESAKQYYEDKYRGGWDYLVLKGNFPDHKEFLYSVFPFGRNYRGLTYEEVDSDGNVTKENYWNYDSQGRPVTFSADHSAISLSYDDRGYCIRAEVNDDGTRNVYEYAYDENGNLTEVRIEEGSRETTFFYEWVKLPNR